jgi:hypothetical protein
MAIYLDAEVLYGLSPTSLALSSLGVIARAHRLEIAIPEVALKEATAKRQEQIETKGTAIRTAIEKARGFFDGPHFREPDAKKLAHAWRTELLKDVRMIPMTSDHAVAALDREINRVPPARDGRGARDTAIWLAIRDDHSSKSEAGYFVSGNRHDFGDADGQLKRELRVELSGGSFTYVQEISELLPLLAEEGGKPFTVQELETVRALKWMMRGRLGDYVMRPDILNELIGQAYGAPLRWTGIVASVREPTLWKIPNQIVYRLPNGQEVGVVQTSWAAFVDLTLSGPSQLIEAGFREGLGGITAEIELLAHRDPTTLEADFSFSGRDKIEVALDASNIPTATDSP